MNHPVTPKLIAFDMDGTLFAEHMVPLPSSLAAIAQAKRRGATIALASGRDPWALRNIAETTGVGLDQLVFFGLNGSVVADSTGRTLWSSDLDRELFAKLMVHVRDYPITVSISAGEDLFIEDRDGFMVELEASANWQKLIVVDDLAEVPVPVHKVLFCAPPEVLQAHHQQLIDPFADRLEFSFSAPTHFEATALGVHKGSALRGYCESVGIDVADTVAFGDNANDLGMLREAGLGVAMGNAIDEAKSAADVVTDDNLSDGIANLLRDRFGL